MKQLTIKQIILLLNINMGSNSEYLVHTQLEDLKHLNNLDLIINNLMRIEVSRKGKDLITLIETKVNNSLEAQ